MTAVNYSIRALEKSEDYQQCVALQGATWGENFSERIAASTIKLIQRLGGVAGGAFAPDGQMLGFVFGMTGVQNGTVVHWSDMLAVRKDMRDQGIGEALKRYQRSELLRMGIGVVMWTFVPLESRNAHFNFARLGTISREYARNLYETSDSHLHAGIGTDRLILSWLIDSQRVAERMSGSVSTDQWHNVPICNPVVSSRGPLVSSPPRLGLDAPAIRVAIPPNIQQLKAHDMQLASAWRQHTRDAFEHYMAREYVVTEFVKGEEYGSYVLERRPLLA